MNISTFTAVGDNIPVRAVAAWPDDFMESLPVAAKEDAPLWAPASFRPATTRANGNVQLLDAMVLDYDGKTGTLPDIEGIAMTWAQRGLEFVLHTSFSRLPLPALSPHPQRLAELLALIESAPHGELGNAFLAKRAGMSLEKFIRWFRTQVGQTPAAYVAETRVRLAKQRLALTDKSIDEISADAGFPNRHYFSRVFARQVGCGPAEFRKRQSERKGV
jgi:AraC-like DNA-binding protein